MSRTKTEAPFLRVATVLKVKGIHGKLLVRCEPGASLLLDTHQVYWLAPPLLEHKELHLVEAESTAHGMIVSFAEIADRGAAHEVLGRDLLLKSSELSEDELSAVSNEDGETFPELGFEVLSDEGVALGVLSERIETPANLVWVVEGPFGELLLPVIADLQIQRDDEARRLTVHLLDGLLELNR